MASDAAGGADADVDDVGSVDSADSVDSVDEDALFGSSDEASEGSEGDEGGEGGEGGGVIETQQDLDAFTDYLEDYEYNLLHAHAHKERLPPGEVARRLRDAVLKQLRCRAKRRGNNVALMLRSIDPLGFGGARAAAAAAKDGAAFAEVVAAEQEAVRAMRAALPEGDAARHPRNDGGAGYTGAFSPEGTVARLSEYIDDFWRSPKTRHGFALAEFWASVTTALRATLSFEPRVNADHYARYVAALLNGPENLLDPDFAPPSAHEARDTLAKALDVAQPDGTLDGDAFAASATRGALRPLSADEMAREDAQRERLFGCRTAPMVEFGIEPRRGSPGSDVPVRYGRAPRAPDGEPLRVRIEFEDSDPAEARVLYIHPVAGMRVQYDELGLRGWVHNQDTWEWVGLAR